jgi:hypothetical protein
MLNPSTAGEATDDPTVRKCISLSRNNGFNGLHILNLFAYRSSSPSMLKTIADPVGPENDMYIRSWTRQKENIVLAWGCTHYQERSRKVLRGLIGYPLLCFGFNRDGSPKHPLYLPSSTKIVSFWG